MTASRMLTYDEAALELGVGKAKARELVRTGYLVARRMGHRTVRITRDSVENYLRLRSDIGPQASKHRRQWVA